MKMSFHRILEAELASKPFSEGSIYVTTDSNRIFADLAGGFAHFN